MKRSPAVSLRPKVGHIQFLNCLPLYYGLVKSDALLDVELWKGMPTELNNLLLTDKLDISPISSIEYARHSDTLVLFPDFTVSSDGEVKSILVLSRVPLDKLSDKKVALTSTSATSHVLLKLILHHGYGAEPEYIVRPPDLDVMLSDADAALLIGDIALKHSVKTTGYYRYDLGAEWKKLTGRKMVYAVWAIRRHFAETEADTLVNVYAIFKKSMDYSMQHLSEIAEYAARWEPFSSTFLIDYFRTLRFDFGKECREGLSYFYKLASEIGELDIVPALQFIDVHSGVNK
jgi:chorismate dehydratase